MKPVRAVLLALLTLCGTVAGVSLAAGVTASSPTTSTTQQSADGADAALGNRISAFMQSNAAETGGAVESGMWTATYESAANRSAKRELVTSNVDALQNRLDQIQERKQRLVERREAGNISRLKYESEMSGLIGRYNALVDAINETERRAEETGANTTELAELRESSKEVTGSEMSAVARNLSGVDAPGLEKANRTDPGAAGNGNGNGKAKGNPSAANNGNGKGKASNNSAVIDAATNTTANATANVTGAVGTVAGTLNGTNGTDPANVTAPERSNGQGPQDGRTRPGNEGPNGSNASDGNRNPATEETTRVVTSVTVTTDVVDDAEPTDGSASAGAQTTAGFDDPATTDATGDGNGSNATVVPTAAFASR